MALSTDQIHTFFDTAVISSRSAASVIRDMLIESLSPHRKRVYECVYDSGRNGITARQIADKLGGAVAGVDNALLELYRLDLLIRSEMKDEHGLYYVYRVDK